MTIHHDKLAYGKLSPLSEELTQEKLAAMLKELEEDGELKEPAPDDKEREPRKKQGF